MSSTTTTAAPTTQKAERKATAAVANDMTVYQQAKYGRMRLPPSPVRVIVGIIALPVILLAYAYRLIRRPRRPRRVSVRDFRQVRSARTR
jgi:hypothetical protein